MASGIDAKNIIVNLTVTGNYAAGMARAGAATQTFGNQANAGMVKAQAGMAKWGATAAKFGKYTALAIAGALVLSAKTAIDFETAFAGVRKTIEASEPEFQRLSDGLRELTTELPIASKELIKIAELGGQLGVEASGLIEFTDTIAKIGVTTTLSTEDAALGFARLDNIMGLNEGSFDRIGATIVDLGNNFAATEDEILRFSLRVAPVGATLGLTTDDVLALATAFTSVGIPAERGGTAVQKSFIKMADAVDMGGEKLDVFAKTAGMASDEFANLFNRDPAQAFSAFVTGLGDVAESGGSAFAVLRSVGLANQRVMGALLGMGNASDTLVDALDRGNTAWGENTALAEEAEKRFGTVASQLIILKNRFADMSVGIGLVLLPYISDLITGLNVVFDWISAIPAPIKIATAAVVGFGAALFLLTKHPVILALTGIAVIVAQIGANARESADRINLLKDAIQNAGQLDMTSITSLLGDAEARSLFGLGFSDSDIDKAVRGTTQDFFDFSRKLVTAIGAEPIEFDKLYREGFNTRGLFDSDKLSKDQESALNNIIKARHSYATAVDQLDEVEKNRRRASIFGIPFPGDDERIAQMERGRRAVQELYRARQGLSNQSEEIRPAFLSDKTLGQIDDALATYKSSINEAFSEVDASIRDQINLWYEFDDELEVAWGQIIETLTRQISAVGGFETLLSGLDLRSDVEKFIRESFNTPALQEAFTGFAEAGFVKLKDGTELTFEKWLALVSSSMDDIIAIVREKWESGNSRIEFKTGEQFLADLKAAADEIINDPNNTYDPASIWLAIIESTLADAEPGMRSKMLDLLSSAFADDGTLTQNVDLITAQIDILRLALLELEGDYNINVTTNFNTIGTENDPRIDHPGRPTDPTPGSDNPPIGRLAGGGTAFRNNPYFVGEQGVELFVPFSSGTVIPNSDLVSAPSNNITVMFNVEKGTAVQDIQTGLVLSGVAELVDLSRAG